MRLYGVSWCTHCRGYLQLTGMSSDLELWSCISSTDLGIVDSSHRAYQELAIGVGCGVHVCQPWCIGNRMLLPVKD